jgi:hypothetical protein
MRDNASAEAKDPQPNQPNKPKQSHDPKPDDSRNGDRNQGEARENHVLFPQFP